METIRIGIVDDDLLMAELLGDYFLRSGGFGVTLQAISGKAFLTMFKARCKPPDVLLINLRMADGSGLEVLQTMLKLPHTMKIVVLSSAYRPEFVGQLLSLGASSYTSKTIIGQQLRDIVEEVYAVGHYWTAEQMRYLRLQISPSAPKLHLPTQNGLSSREIEVLKLLCQQLTTREIADRMSVSVKTVETHKANLLVKTALRNSVGLVVYAIQNGIVDPDGILLLEE
jgi:DNA-binding NarL/FixJ family response regulator